MINALRSLFNEYEIKSINAQNFHEVWGVYESNHKFFVATSGSEATVERGLKDLENIPPNFDIEKRISWGFFEDGKPMAFLAALDGFPDVNCFYIGLLLVNQNLQKKGVGSKIIKALVEAAKVNGYTSLQLGVLGINKTAVEFWEKQGFEVIGSTDEVISLIINI